MTRLTLQLLLMCAMFGCGEENTTAESFRIHAIVRSDEGDPVIGARVQWNTEDKLLTNSNGAATFSVQGKEGDPLQIQVFCPVEYFNDDIEPVRTVLRRIHIPDDPDSPSAADTHLFTCRPKVRSHVLIVRAKGHPGLPIKVQGRVSGTTDSSGIAQVVVTGTPDDTVEVLIDTSDDRTLRPKNPARRFTLPVTGRFLVFDQQFLVKKRAPKRSRVPATIGPTRL